MIKPLLILGILGAAMIAFLVYGQAQYRKGAIAGYNDAIAEVRKQDARAAEAAGRSKEKVIECYEQDRTWDASTGSCVD